MIDEKKLLKDLDSEIRLSIGNNTEVRKVLSQITDVIHRQPQIQLEYETGKMTVEINKDLEAILICAVRYAIGRKSYMPSMVIDYITPLLPYLSYWMLGLMAAEIIDHNYEGGLGDEKIDRPYWLEFLRKIRLEIGGRYEP